MVEFLQELIRYEPSFMLYVSKETWSLIVDHLFDHPYCALYHQSFFKLLLDMFRFRDENLYITVVICQNSLAKMLSIV